MEYAPRIDDLRQRVNQERAERELPPVADAQALLVWARTYRHKALASELFVLLLESATQMCARHRIWNASASDIAADLVIDLLKRDVQLKNPSALGLLGYLKRAARNRCDDTRRRQECEDRGLEAIRESEPAYHPPALPRESPVPEKLDPGDWQFLVRLHRLDFNFAALARLDGIDRATVKRRFDRIRERVRTRFEEAQFLASFMAAFDRTG